MIFNLVKYYSKLGAMTVPLGKKLHLKNGVSRQRGAIHAAESPNNEKQS